MANTKKTKPKPVPKPKEILFKSCQKVFAKMTGYPFWPARVLYYDSKLGKYNVYFYGSKNTGLVSKSSVKPYDLNKENYSKRKASKKLCLALKEIEEDVPPDMLKYNIKLVPKDNVEPTNSNVTVSSITPNENIDLASLKRKLNTKLCDEPDPKRPKIDTPKKVNARSKTNNSPQIPKRVSARSKTKKSPETSEELNSSSKNNKSPQTSKKVNTGTKTYKSPRTSKQVNTNSKTNKSSQTPEEEEVNARSETNKSPPISKEEKSIIKLNEILQRAKKELEIKTSIDIPCVSESTSDNTKSQTNLTKITNNLSGSKKVSHTNKEFNKVKEKPNVGSILDHNVTNVKSKRSIIKNKHHNNTGVNKKRLTLAEKIIEIKKETETHLNIKAEIEDKPSGSQLIELKTEIEDNTETVKHENDEDKYGIKSEEHSIMNHSMLYKLASIIEKHLNDHYIREDQIEETFSHTNDGLQYIVSAINSKNTKTVIIFDKKLERKDINLIIKDILEEIKTKAIINNWNYKGKEEQLRIQHLTIEHVLLKIEKMIKMSFKRKCLNFCNLLYALDDMFYIQHITPLMLFKHRGIINTINTLRQRYMRSLKLPNERVKEIFDDHMLTVRLLAKKLRWKFSKLFNMKEDISFFERYTVECVKFYEAVSQEEIYSMYDKDAELIVPLY